MRPVVLDVRRLGGVAMDSLGPGDLRAVAAIADARRWSIVPVLSARGTDAARVAAVSERVAGLDGDALAGLAVMVSPEATHAELRGLLVALGRRPGYLRLPLSLARRLGDRNDGLFELLCASDCAIVVDDGTGTEDGSVDRPWLERLLEGPGRHAPFVLTCPGAPDLARALIEATHVGRLFMRVDFRGDVEHQLACLRAARSGRVVVSRCYDECFQPGAAPATKRIETAWDELGRWGVVGTLAAMRARGLSEDEIDALTTTNPRALLLAWRAARATSSQEIAS